ncbi:MAG: hypothetical protein M1831_004411 [Alyxoria varia]|nr:MAG: hypothetical protein M1831_004411 [Alyxoria varia]
MADELIVLTCASGKICSNLIPHLYGKTHGLRLVAHSESSISRLQKQYPEAQVMQADMNKQDDARRIVSGATSLLHIGPSFHEHETEIGYQMIDAALEESRQGRFKHFVLSSVIQTQLRKLLNHDCKRYEEEYLMESGLNWTILQPTHFMENFPIGQLVQQEQPVHYAGWDPKVRFSFVALQDYGEVCAKVLMNGEPHYFAQYPLTSTMPESYEDVVHMVGKEIGKDITIEQRPIFEAVNLFLKFIAGTEDAPSRTRDACERLLLYYNRHGIIGNPSVLEWVLGRKATSHQEWIHKQVEKVKVNTV